MKKLLWCLPALALLGCGGEDCHTEIESQDGTSVCLPDPSEKKGACIQNPKPGGLASDCDRYDGCEGVLTLYVITGGEKYLGTCLCRTREEADQWCTGKVQDVERL